MFILCDPKGSLEIQNTNKFCIRFVYPLVYKIYRNIYCNKKVKDIFKKVRKIWIKNNKHRKIKLSL